MADDTLIPLQVVNDAANRTSEAQGPLILSVVVARFGKDESVILTRKGDVARIVQSIRGADLMKLANMVKLQIDSLRPDVFVIDTVGVGGGVYDRLKEMGVRNLSAFVGGESPVSQDGRFLNKIAESWWLMRDWFLKGLADIPNDKGLISQIAGRKYEVSGERKVKLESKEKMAKSPDKADALAMQPGVKMVQAMIPAATVLITVATAVQTARTTIAHLLDADTRLQAAGTQILLSPTLE